MDDDQKACEPLGTVSGYRNRFFGIGQGSRFALGIAVFYGPRQAEVRLILGPARLLVRGWVPTGPFVNFGFGIGTSGCYRGLWRYLPIPSAYVTADFIGIGFSAEIGI